MKISDRKMLPKFDNFEAKNHLKKNHLKQRYGREADYRHGATRFCCLRGSTNPQARALRNCALFACDVGLDPRGDQKLRSTGLLALAGDIFP